MTDTLFPPPSDIIVVMKDYWQSGKYLNLWSVQHLFFGLIVGFVPLLFGFSWLFPFGTLVVIALAWEVFETIQQHYEHWLNKTFDVLLAIIGFWLVHLWIMPSLSSKTSGFIVSAITLAIYLLMCVLGWRGLQKRQHSE